MKRDLGTLPDATSWGAFSSLPWVKRVCILLPLPAALFFSGFSEPSSSSKVLFLLFVSWLPPFSLFCPNEARIWIATHSQSAGGHAAAVVLLLSGVGGWPAFLGRGPRYHSWA